MKIPLAIFFAVAWLLGARATETRPPHPIAWDAMEKTLVAGPRDDAAEFEFTATNISDQPVEITDVKPSCGCTLVDLPASPWRLAPKASGTLRAVVDFEGKDGELTKSLFVVTSAGQQVLQMHLRIPPRSEASRARNLQVATANRQAVFRNDCTLCHAVPANGKLGSELFEAACAICHGAAHRASMVPDLKVARTLRDEAFWTKWIAEGREGSLMPAFAQKHGGPLTDEQIVSLVKYALENLPREPAAP